MGNRFLRSMSKPLAAATITLAGCATAEPVQPLTCDNASQMVVGMDKSQAVQFIKESGFSARIIREDGESFIVTKDYRLDRMNLEIKDGKVLGLYCG